MTVFKAFLKVLNKCKGIIILYSVVLVIFGAFSTFDENAASSFVESKPDIAIVNKDENSLFTKSFVNYIEEHANIKEPDNLDDALFYRELNYIIYIPKNFGEEFLSGKNPELEVKSTGDYQASLAEILVDKYIKTSVVYRDNYTSEVDVIKNTESTLANESKVELTSKLDASALTKATNYYNFANYALLAGVIYVIALILSSFKEINIRKRTIISGMDYKKYNRILFFSNSLFAIILWAFYVVISIILVGDVIISTHGLIYMINSFIFTLCALAIAMVISNINSNKDAINGIVNVVALGSSFLCGSFVPMEWLPDGVLKFAHVLPSYYYIKTNEIVKTLEVFDIVSLKPIIMNMIVLIIFTIGFSILSNAISRRKQRID